jgi:hypothetical protein
LKGAFEGNSYKATDQKGDIIGVTLNEMVTRVRTMIFYFINAFIYIYKQKSGSPSVLSMVKETDDENVMKLWHYLNYVDVKFNMFDKYPDCDAFINVKVVSVNSEYRNSKVSMNLLKMLTCNEDEWYIVSSSNLNATEHGTYLGWKEIFILSYTNYVDFEEKQILFPDKRHDATRVVIKYKNSEGNIENYETFRNLYASLNLLPQSISMF